MSHDSNLNDGRGRTLDELCADVLVALLSFWGIVGITGLCALTAVGFAIYYFCGK